MAAKSKQHWSQEALIAALDGIREEKLSLREAAARYGIPKSTIATYMSGKSVLSKKPGPSTILLPLEEQKLVDYALHMSEIGYGRTKDQLLEMVKKLIESDGRPKSIISQEGSGGSYSKIVIQKLY